MKPRSTAPVETFIVCTECKHCLSLGFGDVYQAETSDEWHIAAANRPDLERALQNCRLLEYLTEHENHINLENDLIPDSACKMWRDDTCYRDGKDLMTSDGLRKAVVCIRGFSEYEREWLFPNG